MCDKRQLRKEMRVQKQAILPEVRTTWSQQICRAVENLQGFPEVQHILLYHALPDEVDTTPMLTRWNGNKQLYLPVVEGDNLVIKPYHPKQLQRGAFGIWEPENTEAVDPAILDWIIVPGVAFDLQMNRLGRGKGYYDRLLSGIRARKIAIAYDLQLCDNIPAEPHDITMDVIVTEEKTIYKTR